MEQSFKNRILTAEHYGTFHSVSEQELVQLNAQHYSMRLDINTCSSLAFSDRPVFGANVTINQDLIRLNTAVSPENTCIGWVDYRGLAHFKLSEQHTNFCLYDFFSADNGEIRILQPLKIFVPNSFDNPAEKNGIFYFTALVSPSQ